MGLKRAAPRLSLGWLFLAVNWVDIVWSALIMAGVEHVAIEPGNTAVTPLNFYDYPITHSLAATGLWMLAAYLLVRALGPGAPGARNRNAIILALAVGSHFVLDLITHRPDLPLWGGSDIYLGFDLWRSMAATAIVEMAILVVGLLIYLRTTRGTSRWGRIGPWVLALLLVAIQMSAYFGPPPPGIMAIGIIGLAGQLLLVLLAFSVDRGRVAAHA